MRLLDRFYHNMDEKTFMVVKIYDENEKGFIGFASIYENVGINHCNMLREYYIFKDRTITDLGKFKKHMYGYDYYV